MKTAVKAPTLPTRHLEAVCTHLMDALEALDAVDGPVFKATNTEDEQEVTPEQIALLCVYTRRYRELCRWIIEKSEKVQAAAQEDLWSIHEDGHQGSQPLFNESGYENRPREAWWF
jgi:hypothetical protein